MGGGWWVERPVVFDGQRWSNAEADDVAIVPADPAWPAQFAAEAAAIQAALGRGGAVLIEHVGSTAVPGLAAKPVIDMLLMPPGDWPRDSVVSALQGIGYVYWAENPDPTRMFFVKGMPPFGSRRTHHVHVRSPAQAARLLRFRDYLRAHSDAATAYAHLKHQLAAAHPTDREAYTRGKDGFVSEILARADAEAGVMMPQIHRATTDHDIQRCWPVLQQLRPHLTADALLAADRPDAQ